MDGVQWAMNSMERSRLCTVYATHIAPSQVSQKKQQLLIAFLRTVVIARGFVASLDQRRRKREKASYDHKKKDHVIKFHHSLGRFSKAF
jgi:hypothetical protein